MLDQRKSTQESNDKPSQQTGICLQNMILVIDHDSHPNSHSWDSSMSWLFPSFCSFLRFFCHSPRSYVPHTAPKHEVHRATQAESSQQVIELKWLLEAEDRERHKDAE